MLFCILPKVVAVLIVGVITFLLMVNGLIKKSQLGFVRFFKETYKGRIADFITAFVIAYFVYDMLFSRLCE